MNARVPLGEVIDLFDNKRVPLNSRQRAERQGPYPYYGAQGIIDHIDDYHFDGRYLLVPEDGENLNSRNLPIAFFATGRFWVNNHAHVLRGKEGRLDSDYLCYWLNNTEISGFITGAAQPKLSQANLCRIEIDLPPLSVQVTISKFLRAYDALIENNTRRIALAEEMARRIFEEWFVQFRAPGCQGLLMADSAVGQIPHGWQVKTIGSVCSHMQAGGTPPRGTAAYWNEGTINWYKTGELWDDFLFSSEERVTESAVSDRRTRLVPPGTFLMAIYGAPTVGRIGITTTAASCNQAALALIPNSEIVGKWFFLHTLFTLREEFNKQAQGAAQQNISKEKVEKTKFVCPPATVVRAFEQLAEPLWDLSLNLQQQVKNLRAQRDLLLPKFMSGEIDVRGAEHTMEAAE